MENFKAFHVLPTRRNLPDNVIVKFFCFQEEETAYRQRKFLEPDPRKKFYPKIPINNKQIYLNERLPAIENMIKNYAEEKNYNTSTNKCVVSVLCLDPNDPNGVNKIMIPVKIADEVNNLKNHVTKKLPRKPLPSGNPFKKTSSQQQVRQSKQKKPLKIYRLSKKRPSVIILLMNNFNPRIVCSKNVITM